MLTSEETATLVEKARERQHHRVDSDARDGWHLFAQTYEENTHIGVFLTPTDLKSPTQVTFELKATSDVNKKVTLATNRVKEKKFEAGETSGWGIPEFLNEAALKRLGTRQLVVTCSITWADGEAAPTADRSDFFNKFEFSDVAVVAADAQPPIFVQSFMLRRSEHFKTILDSEFSESNSTTRLYPPSGTADPNVRFSGDIENFAAFGAEKSSGEDQKPQQDSAALKNDGGPAQAVKRRRLTTSTTSVGGDEQKNLRDFRLIKVPDCRYLYSASFDFLPSPAVFLAEEKEPGTSTKSDFHKWADDQAKSRAYPAFPHAMYRLADCYMEPKVKKRAKGSILQNIKAETAPFELFSQLSLDYPDFQDDVVDFVVANLNDVLATPGWERAVTLVNEGKIPDGARILNKVRSKSRKAAA